MEHFVTTVIVPLALTALACVASMAVVVWLHRAIGNVDNYGKTLHLDDKE